MKYFRKKILLRNTSAKKCHTGKRDIFHRLYFSQKACEKYLFFTWHAALKLDSSYYYTCFYVLTLVFPILRPCPSIPALPHIQPAPPGPLRPSPILHLHFFLSTIFFRTWLHFFVYYFSSFLYQVPVFLYPARFGPKCSRLAYWTAPLGRQVHARVPALAIIK